MTKITNKGLKSLIFITVGQRPTEKHCEQLLPVRQDQKKHILPYRQ